MGHPPAIWIIFRDARRYRRSAGQGKRYVQLNNRLRDFIWYVIIGVGFVGGVLLWVVYVSPHYTIDEKWPTLAYFTACLFGLVIRGYWRVRKPLRFWIALALLLCLHSLGYILLLRQIDRFSPIWYVITGAPEMILVGLVIAFTTKVMAASEKTRKHSRYS